METFKVGDNVKLATIWVAGGYSPQRGVVEEITTNPDFPYVIRYEKSPGVTDVMTYRETELTKIDREAV